MKVQIENSKIEFKRVFQKLEEFEEMDFKEDQIEEALASNNAD